MAVVRKSLHNRKGQAEKSAVQTEPTAEPATLQHTDPAEGPPEGEAHRAARPKRLRQGVVQFPMQILVPEETREALRQRSEDTGASIRHIILRSLAADGFPVPRLTRRRG